MVEKTCESRKWLQGETTLTMAGAMPDETLSNSQNSTRLTRKAEATQHQTRKTAGL
jgi:hypothetical protein